MSLEKRADPSAWTIADSVAKIAIALIGGFWTLLTYFRGRTNEVLGKERAAYGRQIVVSLSRQLVREHGPSFGEKNLRRMIQFAEVFPQEDIVVSLIRQLSWTHFNALLLLKTRLQRAMSYRIASERSSGT